METEITIDREDTLENLQFRHNLARYCIKLISEVDVNDPRRAPALEEYNRQLAEIDARIAKITGKPPAIKIGLKPAVLFQKPGGLKT